MRDSLDRRSPSAEAIRRGRHSANPLSHLTRAIAGSLGLAVLLAAPVGAQETPTAYRDARDQLAAGDTIAALATLRQLTEERPDFAPGFGLLGRVLTDRASSKSTDFRDRKEADKALRRALQLEPNHPLYLLTLGRLMRKQQMTLDARRVLARAEDAMNEEPEALPPSEVAELWYQRGLFHEDAYFDTRHLVFVPDLPISSADCAEAGTFCLNFTRPESFNRHFKNATSDFEKEATDDFERMADAFRKALDADPTHAGAFRRLTIHLIDRGRYRDAEQLTRRYIQTAPDNPWGHITMGLIYQRTGRDSLAELRFERGLDVAPPNIVAHYRNIEALLREEQAESYSQSNQRTRRHLEEVLWRKSDPLYLTSSNEVRVAHLARVAFADLMFADPTDAVFGSETEQGNIYVRYGPPKHIWKVPRDARREMSAQAFATRSTGVEAGGRYIFWNYGWDVPNFIFQKQLRYRRASHMFSSYSKAVEEEARAVQPAVFSTSFELVGYPAQIARFRGPADTIVEVDLYSEVPAGRLLDRPDSLSLGFFLFAGSEHQRVYERKLNIASPPSPQALTYSVPLLEGVYVYSLEAKPRSADRAAASRDTLRIEPFPKDSLTVSDIVLANQVTPKIERPSDRYGFAIKVNRRREYATDDPLAIYWEVYGLQPDDEGIARYHVNLRVVDAEGSGVLAKVAGAFGNLLGLSDDQSTELSFERVVDLTGKDRVPEYLSLELGDTEPGVYAVQLDIEDQATGQRIRAERRFRVRMP